MTRLDHTEAGGGYEGVEEVMRELGLQHRDGGKLVAGGAGDVGEANGNGKVETLGVASMVASKSNASEGFIRQFSKLVKNSNNL